MLDTKHGIGQLLAAWRMRPRAHSDPATMSASRAAWKPILLDGGSRADMELLLELHDEGRVLEVHDRLDDQLVDLIKVRARGCALGAGEVEAARAALLEGSSPEAFGVWAFFPWSGRLVHILPADRFEEVRLDRNRNKVTREEQALLAGRNVGIVGLSVGNAVARTAALEGVCGCLKLADFDCLDLSNLNRLQAGVHEIGCNKAVLAARQIFETNPYARVIVFPDGVNDANAEDFLTGEPGLDVLVDECDDLSLKMSLRRRARELGLPVLMETSDRGMLDVERFDLEPRRPLFHGRVSRHEHRDFRGLSSAEKVPVVLSILGADTLSPRMGASLVEVGESVSTWPQLASDVAHGGASVCTALRRLGLGQPLASGRYHVDMNAILGAHGDAPHVPESNRSPWPPAAAPRLTASGEPAAPAQVRRDPLAIERFLVEHAAMAPSGGNVQPWRFHVDGDSIWVVLVPARAENLLDVDHRASYLALGAAVENMTLAAGSRGLAANVEWLPLGAASTAVARVRISPGSREPTRRAAELFSAVAMRVTDRRLGRRLPLTAGERRALERIALGSNVSLHLLDSPRDLQEVGEILGEGDRVRFLCDHLHREAMSEIRWSEGEARSRRDGLDLPSLELTEKDEAALRLLARPEVVSLLRQQGGGQALQALSGKWMAGASAAVLMTVAEEHPREILQAGRVFQRTWLEATRLGFGGHPMTALLYMFEIEQKRPVTLYNERERRLLHDLDARLTRLFGTENGRTRIMLLRLHRASGTARRSLRLPLESVMAFGPPAAESLS